jgi:hypothetical protein
MADEHEQQLEAISLDGDNEVTGRSNTKEVVKIRRGFAA